jgi:peptidoglycan/LPS O-acetylase OafA/YrhL
MLLAGITRNRILALCLLWPVVGAVAAEAGSTVLVALLEPVYAPFFCIGILLYLLHREGWSGAAGLLLAFNFCVALWRCSAYYIPWSVTVAGAGVSFRALAVLLTLSVAVIAAATLTRLQRLDWRWLSTLGALTYPLYLLHEYPGWVLLHRLGPVLPAHVAVGAVIVAMLVAAHLVHRFVERPLAPRLRRAVERDLGGVRVRPRLPVPRHEAVPQKAERHSRERSAVT